MKDVALGCLPSLNGLTFWAPIGSSSNPSGIDAVNLRACVLRRGGFSFEWPPLFIICLDVRFGLSKLTSQLRKGEIAGVFLLACNSTDACSRSSCLPRFSGRGLTGAGPFLKALAAMRPCDGMSSLVRGSRR